MEQVKQKVTLRTFDTYLALVKNSPGTKMFRNIYADVDGEYRDITDGGDLSCAFFVSSVLLIFESIERVHATVVSTVKDMEKSGWEDAEEPRPGDLIVWGAERSNERKHKHIGFFLGDDKVVSNSKNSRHPIEHFMKMRDRDIERILTNESLRGR